MIFSQFLKLFDKKSCIFNKYLVGILEMYCDLKLKNNKLHSYLFIWFVIMNIL